MMFMMERDGDVRGSSRFVHDADETQLSAAATGARIKARMRVRAMRN